MGRLIGEGETVNTTSGNTTTPFPKVALDTNRKCTNTLKRVDAWLIENCVNEALLRRDGFNHFLFSRLMPKDVQKADRDLMNLYLFGDEQTQSTLRDRPSRI